MTLNKAKVACTADTTSHHCNHFMLYSRTCVNSQFATSLMITTPSIVQVSSTLPYMSYREYKMECTGFMELNVNSEQFPDGIHDSQNIATAGWTCSQLAMICGQMICGQLHPDPTLSSPHVHVYLNFWFKEAAFTSLDKPQRQTIILVIFLRCLMACARYSWSVHHDDWRGI